MFLDKLYSRRTDGGLQEWTIEINDDKYRTISGMVDGEKVTSEWTVCLGKNIGRSNETTPAMQALAEAKAKWQKKRDKGYSPTQDTVDDHGLFKPMLAKEYGSKPIAFPLYTQPKLDGVRCIANKDGLWSRNGKPLTGTPHINKALEPYFKEHPNVVFDGELYGDKLSDDFNKIIHFVRQEDPTEEEIDQAKDAIQYHIYDFPPSGKPNQSSQIFSLRYKTLEKAVKEISNGCVVLVETHLVDTQEELDQYYGKFIEDGYEGQIVRLDGQYENKRSYNLLKRKTFTDSEFVIKDIIPGVGNRSGMAGKILFAQEDGKKFEASIKGSRSYFRELLFNKQKYIGEFATVKHFNRTPDGIPRFPVVKAIRNYE
jgi:DNA ligase 1